MKHLFTKLLDLALKIASKPKAVYFLFTISFFESFFFIPLPPDFILAPMVLSKPQKAWFYASITLLGSFIGSCIGFAIGFFVIDFAIGFIETLVLQEYYAQAVSWFTTWGAGMVFVAGFSFVPYWIFTIAAGAMKMNFIFFIIAASLSRGTRFYLVAGAAYFGGEKGMPAIRKNIDKVGWLILILFVVYVLWKTI